MAVFSGDKEGAVSTEYFRVVRSSVFVLAEVGLVVICLAMPGPAAAQGAADQGPAPGPAVVSSAGAFAAAPVASLPAAADKAVPPAAPVGQRQPPAVAPAAPVAKPSPSKLSRWLEFQTGTLGGRYRSIETSQGVRSANQAQYSGQVKGRFKFDPAGRVSVTAFAATGTAFTSGWNTTGIGTGDPVRQWSLKHLYVSIVPVAGAELSYGSLGFVRGESTEITTFDNDGYLSGERLSVKRPKDLYFDEVAVTSGFVGDVTAAAVWDRWDSLVDSRNYVQYFVSKKVSKTVGASADYTRFAGVGTVRAGMAVKTPRAHVVDALRYEQYVRGGPKAASGFAVFGDKAVSARLTAGIGFANIDLNYGSLNADRFGKGRRVYETMALKVTKDFSFQVFMGQAVSNDVPLSNKYRVDIIGSYNVLGALQRRGMLK